MSTDYILGKTDKTDNSEINNLMRNRFHMVLNPDCIRNILLYVESVSTYGEKLTFGYNLEQYADNEYLKTYSLEELFYHLRQCCLSGYFHDYHLPKLEEHHFDISVLDLSPVAHEFVSNVRNDTIWNKVKSKISITGDLSISIVLQLAATSAFEVAKKKLLGA